MRAVWMVLVVILGIGAGLTQIAAQHTGGDGKGHTETDGPIPSEPERERSDTGADAAPEDAQAFDPTQDTAANGGWRRLKAQKLPAALASRTLGFPDGSVIGFFSDGRALQGWDWGHWWIEGDLVCLDWPARGLRCYAVARRGIDLQFRHANQRVTGRYIDLN